MQTNINLKSGECHENTEDMEYTSITNHSHVKGCSVKDGLYLNAKIGFFPTSSEKKEQNSISILLNQNHKL